MMTPKTEEVENKDQRLTTETGRFGLVQPFKSRQRSFKEFNDLDDGILCINICATF